MGFALMFLLAAAPAVPVDYDTVKAELSALRATTAARYLAATTAEKKSDVLAEARAALLRRFDAQLFPAWAGTAWDFYGTTETPRAGKIACGYFVSTLMRDAGFKVPRVRLAQQASEKIVRSLAEEEHTLRFRDLASEEVVTQVREKLGEGLYVVGMDFHVGFLRITATQSQLCHAAFFEPQVAICEDAASSAGFSSRYHVIGRLFLNEQLRAWLEGQNLLIR